MANVSGKLKEVVPVVTSAGAANASQIPQTDSTGRLDVSLMPVGIAAEVMTVTASEALAAGAFVNVYNNAGTLNARNADASNNQKPATGFVLSAVSNAGAATVYLISQKNTALSSLTLGAEYWLSDTVPGGISATAPTAAAHIVQFMGRADSATSLVFANETYYELS